MTIQTSENRTPDHTSRGPETGPLSHHSGVRNLNPCTLWTTPQGSDSWDPEVRFLGSRGPISGPDTETDPQQTPRGLSYCLNHRTPEEHPMTRSLNPTIKTELLPIAESLAALHQQADVYLRGLDDDELQTFLDHTLQPSPMNCWWATYQAAGFMREQAEAEAWRRTRAATS